MEQTLDSLRRFFEAATRDKGTNEVTFQVEAEFTDPNGEMRNDTFILECSMPDMKMRIRPNIKQPQ
jgi:hypothetical protein